MAVNHLRRLTLVHAVTQALIVTQHVNQLVCQVILHLLVVVHHDRGADRQRRNRQDRAHHPLGASELGVEAQLLAVLGRHALEGAEDHLRLQRSRRHARVLALGNRHLSL